MRRNLFIYTFARSISREMPTALSRKRQSSRLSSERACFFVILWYFTQHCLNYFFWHVIRCLPWLWDAKEPPTIFALIVATAGNQSPEQLSAVIPTYSSITNFYISFRHHQGRRDHGDQRRDCERPRHDVHRVRAAGGDLALHDDEVVQDRWGSRLQKSRK
jgi:hypothetical protein